MEESKGQAIFLSVIGDGAEYAELRKLLIEAERRNKFVIHYGL